jgi:hypothetical protein
MVGATGELSLHKNILFPIMIQNPFYFHAQMAMSRLFRLQNFGLDHTNDQLIVYHRTQAYKGLNDALADITNDAVVWTVIACFAVDWLLGNTTAVTAHQSGLTRLLSAREKLPPTKSTPFLDLIIGHMPWSSLSSRENTPSPSDPTPNTSLRFVPIYPQHPFPTTLRETLSRLPPGFQDLCATGEISQSTIIILNATLTSLQPEHMTSPQWLSVFDQNFDHTHRRPGGMKAVDALLLQGLLGFSIQRGFDPPAEMYSVSRDAMVKRVNAIEEDELRDLAVDERIRNALLWIYLSVVGAMEVQDSEVEDGEYLGLLWRIAGLFEQGDLAWERIVVVLERFWFPGGLVERWRGVMGRVVERCGL